MQNGDQIWMIGFGFKCNSIVWQCIQTVSSFDGLWAGMSSKKKKCDSVPLARLHPLRVQADYRSRCTASKETDQILKCCRI
jgi:hypothetical protein